MPLWKPRPKSSMYAVVPSHSLSRCLAVSLSDESKGARALVLSCCVDCVARDVPPPAIWRHWEATTRTLPVGHLLPPPQVPPPPSRPPQGMTQPSGRYLCGGWLGKPRLSGCALSSPHMASWKAGWCPTTATQGSRAASALSRLKPWRVRIGRLLSPPRRLMCVTGCMLGVAACLVEHGVLWRGVGESSTLPAF